MAKSFNWKWVWASMAIFLVMELFLGGLVVHVLQGRYVTRNLHIVVQGVMQLFSYFLGGLVIGLISPGRRIQEPAIGAFLSVFCLFVLAIFTPYLYIGFSMVRVLIFGSVAFFLALAGARMGERAMGNRK